MKKATLLIAFILLGFSLTQAQISQGSIWLGGNIGFSSSKNQTSENEKSSFYLISPSIGKAVSKNTIIGVELNFDRNTFKNDDNDLKTSHSGGGLFAREYWTVVKRFYAFGHFRTGYSAEKRKSEYTSFKEESNGWSVSLSAAPGFAFALNKSIQLETMLNDLFYVNYAQSEVEATDSNGTTSRKRHSGSGGINFEGTSTMTIGIRFLITK